MNSKNMTLRKCEQCGRMKPLPIYTEEEREEGCILETISKYEKGIHDEIRKSHQSVENDIFNKCFSEAVKQLKSTLKHLNRSFSSICEECLSYLLAQEFLIQLEFYSKES